MQRIQLTLLILGLVGFWTVGLRGSVEPSNGEGRGESGPENTRGNFTDDNLMKLLK